MAFSASSQSSAQSAHDFSRDRAQFPSNVIRRIVAEDADVRRAEHLAQIDGPLELLQVRLERLIGDRILPIGEPMALSLKALTCPAVS